MQLWPSLRVLLPLGVPQRLIEIDIDIDTSISTNNNTDNDNDNNTTVLDTDTTNTVTVFPRLARTLPDVGLGVCSLSHTWTTVIINTNNNTGSTAVIDINIANDTGSAA